MWKNYLVVSVLFFVFASNVLAGSVHEIELNKDWTLTNEDGSIVKENLEIPSGVYSALYGEDVLKSYNDVNLRWIGHQNWKYSTNFSVPENEWAAASFVNITFHGVDTIAQITLNGKCIGKTENMFVRYTFSVKDDLIVPGNNLLEVEIESPLIAANRTAAWLLDLKNITIPPECPPPSYNGECHMNMLRKMQASFGWDWGLAVPSLGIWKVVTVELYSAAVIRDVDVSLSKSGDSWLMNTRVFLDTELNKPFYGELMFYAVELLDQPRNISYRDYPIDGQDHRIIEFNVWIPQEKVILWWPNGYGVQKLYPLHFTLKTWQSESGPDMRELSISQKSIRIGFRTIELVEDKLDNGNSFYFRVNGVPIFMKGTNYIPSHILPEYSNDLDRIDHLLTSARDAHMNMIRVWGGGIYESDYFYDRADYLGLLIWQDMMFACSMYPINNDFLENVRIETIQNAKRIAYHPSIAIFAANNENEAAIAQNWYSTNDDLETYAYNYRQLYVGIITHELGGVLRSSNSRPKALTSSPSNGVQTVDENYLARDPQDSNYGDVHFYETTKDSFDPMIYPRPRFASEYGFQGLPSLSSWKRIMNPDDDFNELLSHRQHHPLGTVPVVNLIIRHLPLPLETSNPKYNEALIYFSQISQAMVTKTETEVYRQERGTTQNTMGALYWQLNDVWVAPSWSSIDFFGNYKILHYWAKEFLAPFAIIAHLDRRLFNKVINITIVSDEIETKAFNASVTVNTYMWSDLFPKKSINWETEIEPNSNARNNLLLKDLLVQPFDKNNCFFEFVLKRENEVLAKNYLFPDNIKAAVGVLDPQIMITVSKTQCQGDLNSISLSVIVQHPAIFVYIEVVSDAISKYKLSKNGFMQLEPIQTVILEFDHKPCITLSPKDIKVMTVNEFFPIN